MLGHLDAKPKVGYFLGKEQAADGKLKDKLLRLKVRDRMSRPIVIMEQATIHDAVIELFTENTGMLAVTDAEGQLAGIVSLKDLLKVTLGNSNASAMPVSMVMTRLPRIVAVGPDDSLWEAAKKMLDHQVGGLPVVRTLGEDDGRGRLEVVGRITKTVMTQVLVDLSSEL